MPCARKSFITRKRVTRKTGNIHE